MFELFQCVTRWKIGLVFAMSLFAACAKRPLDVANGASAPLDASAPVDAMSTPCAADESGFLLEIIACGLSSKIALIGVDAQAAYVLTDAGDIVRTDLHTHEKTKLYTLSTPYPLAPVNDTLLDFPLHTDPQLRTIHLNAASIYFTEVVDGQPSIVAIDTSTPTIGAPHIVTSGLPQMGIAIAVDDQNVYWQSAAPNGTGALGPLLLTQVGPIMKAALTEGSGAVLVEPMESLSGPLFVQGGFVYFVLGNGPSLARVPVTGGTYEIVVGTLDVDAMGDLLSPTLDIAVTVEHIYVTMLSPGDGAIDDFVSGAAPAQVYVSPGGEIPAGPPTGVRIDGGYYYFVVLNGIDAGLQRAPIGASSAAGGDTVLPVAPAEWPPVFDDTFFYVAFSRGSANCDVNAMNASCEGVIARHKK